MKQIVEQEIRKVLSDFDPEDVDAVVAFVKSIFLKREAEMDPTEPEVSDCEHARILRALDAVSALSSESGPAVSNRDHDRYFMNNKHGVVNE